MEAKMNMQSDISHYNIDKRSTISVRVLFIEAEHIHKIERNGGGD